MPRVSTGVDALDRLLGGGLAAGTFALVRTPPGTQGEQLLKQIAGSNATLYLSTLRAERDVREWLANGDEPPEFDVRFIEPGSTTSLGDTVTTVLDKHANGHSPHDSIEALVMGGGEKRCIVIDPINPLETGAQDDYAVLLREFKDHLQATGAIGLVHAVNTPAEPDCRWVTLQLADDVWDVEVTPRPSEMEFTLSVIKSRSGHLPTGQIKLDLGERVAVDTSRDIA